MIIVKADPGDTSDSLIRKFTRKVISEGLLLELKKKEFYQKPAEVRKEQKKEIERRVRARRRAKRNK
ncbi:30S ribosomal protein S21 [Candidatus Gottesmanbacteria bacterium RBG_13_37_7]|uniref:Small ribosomal subunit protein bS21 n=1 Tax=Candidatus Gottesmanbacteria bacterium RBG_13_37_7 TaxID=1798369 RepID=A0A1F5YG55_9BACT|nr:MAG: 30S ribosomal protein S21 [Candidatus Gottesmanbacteria bacterium RBG_13_37_7]